MKAKKVVSSESHYDTGRSGGAVVKVDKYTLACGHVMTHRNAYQKVWGLRPEWIACILCPEESPSA